jgi:cysteinyl-tRNA synthetase
MIHIYDSLQGKKVPFEKAAGETVGMYVCGPTVYDNGHLGHGRSAVAFDIVRRFLLFMDYDVNFVFNYTDIEDKMITRAAKEGITVPELADRISPLYDEDYGKLGIMPPSHNPKATEYVEEMIDIVKNLEEKGHAYVLEDGVYYDITTFNEYGKLSHQKLDELNAGARVEERKDKRNHQDFVLWKFKKEGEPSWPSPWGEGRPGWHIECSAMSRALLGKTFDIHGGGLDLKFPHHECEIAQSEAANETTFSRYWMHNGYITINQEKMSKSLGNFFTLRDIFKEYHPRVVRFFLIGTHYRSPIEFSREMLDQARNTLKGLDDFYLRNSEGGVDEGLISAIKEKMSNDMDVAGSIALIFEWINGSPNEVRGTLDKLNELFNVFPIDFEVTAEQQELIKKRESARAEKNWARSDEIRDQLLAQDVEIEDASSGSFMKPKI